MSYQESQLVEPVRRELVEIANVGLMFEKMSVGRRARQCGASCTLVLGRTMLVGIADPELIAVGEVVKDATGSKEVVRWVR